MTNIKSEAAIYLAQKSHLLDAHPDLADDEQTLTDTLEGITDLQDKLVALFESAREDEMLAEMAKNRALEILERSTRLQGRNKAKRTLIVEVMEMAGIKKIEAPEVTLATRKNGPKLLITDEAGISDRFKKEVISQVIDEAAIKQALVSGEIVGGAVLSNGSVSLLARVK